MYQKRISLLFILAFSLSILISCGGDPGTNIKSGKVHTGYYDEMSEYVPMVYKRSDIVETNDNYTISFKLPKTEPFDYYWERWSDNIVYYKNNIPNSQYIVKQDWSNTVKNVVRNHSYKNQLKVAYGDNVIKIARTDIKTDNDNYKYYLYITLNGVETNDYYTVQQSDGKSVHIFTNYIETFNIVFTTMMRDSKSKNEPKPIHVESYWIGEDLITRKNHKQAVGNVKFDYLFRFQIYKFIDEIDYGYRGKLPPKPIDEDDEY